MLWVVVKFETSKVLKSMNLLRPRKFKGIGIWNWDLELGIWIWNRELGLELGAGELELGIRRQLRTFEWDLNHFCVAILHGKLQCRCSVSVQTVGIPTISQSILHLQREKMRHETSLSHLIKATVFLSFHTGAIL